MEKFKRLFPVLPVLLVAALAQQAQDFNFQPTTITEQVQNYIVSIAGAGVVLLGLVLGLSAAWKYARKFLKG